MEYPHWGDKGKDKAQGAADSRGGLGAAGKHPAPLWLPGESQGRFYSPCFSNPALCEAEPVDKG